MHKVVDFPRTTPQGEHRIDAARPPAGAAATDAATAPPSIGSIYRVIGVLSRTLNNVKSLCATMPAGPARRMLEAEHDALVASLHATRIVASRLLAS